MSDCVFCGLLSGELISTRLYRDPVCTALMDIQPITPGHVLVIPNQHAAYLADLDPDAGAQMFRVAQRVAAALRRSGLKCEGVNFHLADGDVAGQEVFHVHLHVFPRYEGDGFGLRFAASYFERPPRAQLEEAAKKIRAVL